MKKYKYINRKGEFKELKPTDKVTPESMREIILDSTELKLTKTKKGKRGIAVFDRITGKRLSITKWKKYVGIDKPTAAYLKTEDFESKFKSEPEGFRINSFIENLLDIHKFNLPVSTDHLESYVTGYQIYWNMDLVSKSEMNNRILALEQSLEEKPYLIKIKLQVVRNEIYIREEGKIYNYVHDYVRSDRTQKSFTDSYGNFVLMSS